MAPSGKEPLYQQLHQQLRQLITGGECAPGARFLTERQISEQFQISRPTANKILSNLVSEGLLEFRKGVGTFVRPRALGYNLRALVSFTEEALAAGKQPSTQVLSFQSLASGSAPAARERLRVEAGAGLVYFERLRLADDMPVIFEKRTVVADYCAGLHPADLAGSLYALWTERFGLELEGADESLRAVSLRGADARALRTPEGAAGLLIRSVGYLAGGVPLWFEETLYRGDAYEFHNRLGGLRPAVHVSGRFLEPAAQ